MTTFFTSLVVSVCAAIVTVLLSLRRFRIERWWERKADAYLRIIEALHALAEHSAARADAEEGDPDAKEEARRTREAGQLAWVELRRATVIGTYIISNEAAGALNRLWYRSRVEPVEVGWPGVHSDDHKAYTEALAEMQVLAKEDLGLTRLSGWTRLAAAMSGVWVMLAPAAYFMGRASYASWWTESFGGPTLGVLESVPASLEPDAIAFALFWTAPVLTGWVILFVVPRTVRWVRDGFSPATSRRRS